MNFQPNAAGGNALSAPLLLFLTLFLSVAFAGGAETNEIDLDSPKIEDDILRQLSRRRHTQDYPCPGWVPRGGDPCYLAPGSECYYNDQQATCVGSGYWIVSNEGGYDSCPDFKPRGGDACYLTPGTECHFYDASATCVGSGYWVINSNNVDNCPVFCPQRGSPCDMSSGVQCSYLMNTATCTGSVWTVDSRFDWPSWPFNNDNNNNNNNNNNNEKPILLGGRRRLLPPKYRECPTWVPRGGDACYLSRGTECYYEDATATCVGSGYWDVVDNKQGPKSCPWWCPQRGSPCNLSNGRQCNYIFNTATCTGSGYWTVDSRFDWPWSNHHLLGSESGEGNHLLGSESDSSNDGGRRRLLPPSLCPGVVPRSGNACFLPRGRKCYYPETTASCIGSGYWQVSHDFPTPGPEPVGSCPHTAPLSGNACYLPLGTECSFSDCTATCGGSGYWMVDQVAPPPSGCPVNLPLSGDACYRTFGSKCYFPHHVATCGGSGYWMIEPFPTPVPTNKCPAYAPQNGDACWGAIGSNCHYSDRMATCVGSGVWVVNPVDMPIVFGRRME